MRHLILLDFRSQEEFDKSHIRKSIRVDLNNYKQVIASLIVSLNSKPTDNQTTAADEAQKAIGNLNGSTIINGNTFKS